MLFRIQKIVIGVHQGVGVGVQLPFSVFSDISERNNDYSDTPDFRRGRWGWSRFSFGGPCLRIHNVNILLYIYEPLAHLDARRL